MFIFFKESCFNIRNTKKKNFFSFLNLEKDINALFELFQEQNNLHASCFKKCGVVGTPCDFPDGDDIIIDPVEPFIYNIQCTRNTICKHLELREKKKDEIDRYIRLFNQYIGDTNPFKDFNKSDDECSWFQIRFASKR